MATPNTTDNVSNKHTHGHNGSAFDGLSNKNTHSWEPQTGASEGLAELFHHDLTRIYWAEKALVKAIPEMIKKATNAELIDALKDHLSVTENQVGRAEEVFQAIDAKAQAVECIGIKALIEEAGEAMKQSDDPSVRDACIIAAAQKVEHYEIAAYGTLHAYALALGFNEAASLLEETLNEEKEADQALTSIAEEHVNVEALHAEA